MLTYELRHPVVDLLPLLVRADRGQGRGRDLHRQVQLAEGARVHEGALTSGPDQEASHLVERLLGGGEPDPLDRPAGERLQPFQRECQVAPTLVAHEGVDLVDDRRLRRGQHRAPALAGEEQVEGFGRGHQDVRWPARHRCALCGRRVARPHQHPQPGQEGLLGGDLREGALQVLLDVVRERAKRRDVQHLRLVGQVRPLAQQRVDGREEGGEGLAGPRGGRDQHVPALPDHGPALALRRRGLAEAAREPGLYGRVEGGEAGHQPIIVSAPDSRGPLLEATACRPAAGASGYETPVSFLLSREPRSP